MYVRMPLVSPAQDDHEVRAWEVFSGELGAQPAANDTVTTLLCDAPISLVSQVGCFTQNYYQPKHTENWNPPGSYSICLHPHQSICLMALKFFDLSAPYTVSFLKVFRAPASSKYPNTKKMIKKKRLYRWTAGKQLR